MISSPERIAANQANAKLSTGPKTAEGKEASRANGYKHGLTGAGIVQAQAEAADVADMARKFRAEMRPVTEIGASLLDEMAVLAVRKRRCHEEELLRLAAMNDGEGGLFDSSPEGQLAFKYELAAHRNFHKAHAEFRKVEAEAKANGIVAILPPVTVSAPVASSLPATPSPSSPVEPPVPAASPMVTPTHQADPGVPILTPEVLQTFRRTMPPRIF